MTNLFAFTIAVMGAAAVLFLVQRSEAAPQYRLALTLMGIVCLVAAYNYRLLYVGWTDAYSVVDGAVRASGVPYTDVYRYTDWLVTVPSLLVVLVLVMDLTPKQTRVRGFILALLAFEMIVIGYPGQLAVSHTTRLLWWASAMVPFLLIIYQLYVSLGASVRSQPAEAKGLIVWARFLTVVIWSVYPVLYLLPLLGLEGRITFVATQVAYALADIMAKAVFGVLIYLVVMVKSQALREAGAKPSAGPPPRTATAAA